jgi:hypothetical protein
MSSNELFRRVAMDAITTMDIPPLAADSPLQEAPEEIQPYPADQPPPPGTIDGP